MPKNPAGIMREFKQGSLHSGSKKGPKVTNRKQAVAIALNQKPQPPQTTPNHTTVPPLHTTPRTSNTTPRTPPMAALAGLKKAVIGAQ